VPARHDTVHDVRIAFSETLGDFPRVGFEKNDGAVDRVGQRAAENQLPARVRRPGVFQMKVAEARAIRAFSHALLSVSRRSSPRSS
jgi:hypothetical protein